MEYNQTPTPPQPPTHGKTHDVVDDQKNFKGPCQQVIYFCTTTIVADDHIKRRHLSNTA